jgi:hypothetical protein
LKKLSISSVRKQMHQNTTISYTNYNSRAS